MRYTVTAENEVYFWCIWKACLRLVEDSDGLRLSLRGVQGVAAGVPNRVLVITQEDDAGTGFRLETKQIRGKQSKLETGLIILLAVLENLACVITVIMQRGHFHCTISTCIYYLATSYCLADT